MDTVCKDLGKTYDEVFALPYYLIKWHYFNAERRNALEVEEKNEFQKLLVLLIRPDIYEAMEKKENGGEIESAGFVETEIEKDGQIITMSTFDNDDFMALIKNRQEMIKNPVVVEEIIEGQTKAVRYDAGDFDGDDAVYFERR